MPKGEALIFGAGVAGIFYLLNKEATHQQRQTKNSNQLATLLSTQLFGKTDEIQKRKGIICFGVAVAVAVAFVSSFNF